MVQQRFIKKRIYLWNNVGRKASKYVKFYKMFMKTIINFQNWAQFLNVMLNVMPCLDKILNILNEHRPENEYFRVSFYGGLFSTFLQNTTFIFRGLQFEKISNFTHRIKKEFPNAQLLTKKHSNRWINYQFRFAM